MLFLSRLRSRCQCPVLWCLLVSWSLVFASPLIQPPQSTTVCSSTGLQWVDLDNDGAPVTTGHALDCALCLPTALPSPSPLGDAWLLDFGHHQRAIATATRHPVPEATPPPARGPPRFPSPTLEVFT